MQDTDTDRSRAFLRLKLIRHGFVILNLVLLLVVIPAAQIAQASSEITPPSQIAPGPTYRPTHPREDVFLDVDWYRATLLQTADLWNGGLDGESGMGVYQPGFTGFFHVALNQRWKQIDYDSITTVAQSRAIYMNVEAYRAADEADKQRFLDAVNQGVNFLPTYFVDPEYGGYYWQINVDGSVLDDMKQGYGNVHPIFALAQAYSITHNPAHLQAALDQVDFILANFADPNFPGGLRPNYNRDLTEISGVNNIDNITHFYEALLALYDVTEGEQHEKIIDLINLYGGFIVHDLYHDQDGFTDRGYLAYNYDENWQPSLLPYTRETQWTGARQASPGHGIELAYLFSRAVERGFDPEWLTVSDKMIKFCFEYAINPETGGMLYDLTDYDGTPLEGNPDNPMYIWWAQMETARALLHFTVVRGEDYGAQFKQVEALIHDHLMDQRFGGVFDAVDSEHKLAPVNTDKGHIWKVNYHYSMFFAEVLRLAAVYPDAIPQ
ncbi:MAG TPA: AGE family epimerase/isomerase [Phototrophicaceae bacterium]|nr:AGE family epimerase/isomerase [Phototrophicaceae bacterium]